MTVGGTFCASVVASTNTVFAGGACGTARAPAAVAASRTPAGESIPARAVQRHPRRGARAVACALVVGRIKLPTGRAGALPAIIGGAVLLRLIGGVGFANYDTLYALSWAAQLPRGQAPAYEIPAAPPTHPPVEALGGLLEPP